MPESNEDFLKRISIKCRAQADQNWMALEGKVVDMMELWMRIHHAGSGVDSAAVVIYQRDIKLLKHVLSLMAYELTQRIQSRNTEGT